MSKQYEVGSMQQELLPTAYCLLLTETKSPSEILKEIFDKTSSLW
jgi:hypothetical protein